MKTASTLLIASLAAISAASAQIVTTNLNETFATDGNITNTTQNLPGGAAWYSANNAADANISGNVLTFGNITNTAYSGALAYFTTAGSYVSLTNEGDSISVSFNYRYATNDNRDGGFRFGLYSSGGSRVTQNSNTFNNIGSFSNWTGYITRSVFGTNGINRAGVAERTNGSTAQAIFTGATTTLTNLNVANSSATNTWLSASMTLTLTNSSIVIMSSVAGQNFYATDSITPLRTSFDSLAIGSAAPIGSFDIDNVLITSSTIPEPTTVAMLGLSGLALVAYRLRRRKR